MTARLLNDVLLAAKKLNCKPEVKIYMVGPFFFYGVIEELNVTNDYVKMTVSGDTHSTMIALDKVVAVKMEF